MNIFIRFKLITNNIKGCLKKLFSYLIYSQIWLNLLTTFTTKENLTQPVEDNEEQILHKEEG
jgi:hypothetical protein